MNKVPGKIIIVGDLFPVPSNFQLFEEGDILSLFGKKICSLFSSADLSVCNLEGPLTDSLHKCIKTGPALKAPTFAIRAYQELGIGCYCLANNHITDAGNQGLLDTIETLSKRNLPYIGAGPNVENITHYKIFSVADRQVGIYNVAETMYNEPTKTTGGAFLYDEYLVCKELEELRRKCDYLVVIYHGGAEKFRYPTPQVRKRFYRMADSGANMILSQHTHCVGCEEYYKGAYLLYGQGNFLFRSFNNEFTDTGLIVEILFEDKGVQINKYLVDAIEDKVRYNEQQDFTSFYERSEKAADIDYISELFNQYCEENQYEYLKALRGKFFLRRILRRLCPSRYRKRINLSHFDDQQLLFLIHMMRSEQNREIVLTGLLNSFTRRVNDKNND